MRLEELALYISSCMISVTAQESADGPPLHENACTDPDCTRKIWAHSQLYLEEHFHSVPHVKEISKTVIRPVWKFSCI